jgi:hypothetical protein
MMAGFRQSPMWLRETPHPHVLHVVAVRGLIVDPDFDGALTMMVSRLLSL